MATEATISQPGVVARPYAPSWVNVITTWIERLPGPTWLAYPVGMVLGVLLSAGAATVDVAVQGNSVVALAYYGVLPFAILALIHSLDRTASGALQELRPHLAMDEGEISEVLHRLTVAPARPAALIALFSAVVTPLGYVMDPVGSGIVGYSPPSLLFRWFWESLVASIFLVLVYHTIRQLRLIGQVHGRVREVDVFDQSPLYAMSRVTSRTAIGLVILVVPSLFLLPSEAGVSTLVISAGWYGSVVAIGAAAFFLPLWGMHDRLAGEKRRLQGEVGRRLSATVAAIHAAVDVGDGPGIEARNRALATLIAEA